MLALSVDGLSDGTGGKQDLLPGLVRSFVEKHELPFGSRRATSEMVDRLDVIHDVVMTTRTQLDDKYTLPVPASFLLDGAGHLAVIYKGPVSVEILLSDVKRLVDDSGTDLAIAYSGRWFLRPHGLLSVVVRVADRLVRRGHLDLASRMAGLAADLSERNGNPFDLRHKAAGALIELGNAWDSRERYEQAAAAFRRAHEVDPADAAAVTNLGNVTLRLGDHRSAERYYRQAIDLDPNQLQARMNLGSICLQQQRIFDAVKHLQAAVRMYPRFPSAHNMLGMALLRQGRRADAKAEFERAVELDPEYEDARANLKAVSGLAASGGGS